MGGVHGGDRKIGACIEDDGRPEEGEMFDVDTAVTARGKKRRALSAEERPSATEEDCLPREMSDSGQGGMGEHPLQASVTALAGADQLGFFVIVCNTSELVRVSRSKSSTLCGNTRFLCVGHTSITHIPLLPPPTFP